MKQMSNMKLFESSPILILKKLRLKNDVLSLFTNENSIYQDLEREDDDENDADCLPIEDIYEVNIFHCADGVLSTGFTIDKKFLDTNFIGKRDPGDIGIMKKLSYKGGMKLEVQFDDNIRMKYYQSLLNYYKDTEIEGILLQSERNKRINKINE
jgi:hypothetical protein